MYGFLSLFIQHGWAIILFTVLVKLAMSPITYKSFCHRQKMKVLRPEINELGKNSKDPMKSNRKQKLYNKAGVNPMAGCIPGLMQAPIFYALFQFFPSAISLRQKDFFGQMIYPLLTLFMSYHFIFQHGSHISLFPILASIAIFYMN
jgi:YidC/Oxa1 family membrane protein insertase